MSLPVPRVLPRAGGGAGARSHVSRMSGSAIQLSGLPAALSEEQVRTLLQPFGTLTLFQLRDCRAIFRLENVALTDAVVGALNGVVVANHTLSTARLDDSAAAALLSESASPAPLAAAAAPPISPAPTASAPPAGSVCLEIINVASESDVLDAARMAEIEADVRRECSELGDLTLVQMPKANEVRSPPPLATRVVPPARAPPSLSLCADRRGQCVRGVQGARRRRAMLQGSTRPQV